MPGSPGDLLSVGELRKDQLVEGWSVHDGKWCPAKVASVDGEGDAASATLSYIGYASRWNETFSDADHAIRVRLTRAQREVENMPAHWRAKLALRNADGTWPIEKLLGKRKRSGCVQYLVRWKEFDAEDDSWESANLKPEIIDEFEWTELLKAKRAAKPPKAPPAPFTRALADAESDEVKQLRVADAADDASFVGEEAGERASRQKTAMAEVKVCSVKPITAVRFNAFREMLASRALAADPDRNVDLAVTPITSLRRGQRPVDEFSVMCDGVLNEILGERALTVHNNGTAVKLVPPLDCFLRARRDEAGNLKQVMEMVAKAHVVALVSDHGAPGQPIFRTDAAAFEYTPEDVAAYRRAMAGALVARAAAGGVVSAEFAAWAHGSH